MHASLHSWPTYACQHVHHDPRVYLPTLIPEHLNIYLQLYVCLQRRLHVMTICTHACKTVCTPNPTYSCPYPCRAFPLCLFPSRPVVVGIGWAWGGRGVCEEGEQAGVVGCRVWCQDGQVRWPGEWARRWWVKKGEARVKRQAER